MVKSNWFIYLNQSAPPFTRRTWTPSPIHFCLSPPFMLSSPPPLPLHMFSPLSSSSTPHVKHHLPFPLADVTHIRVIPFQLLSIFPSILFMWLWLVVSQLQLYHQVLLLYFLMVRLRHGLVKAWLSPLKPFWWGLRVTPRNPWMWC